MLETPMLVPATYSVWGLNNGVCANVGCGNANRKNKVAATNSDDLPNFLFMEHHAGEFGASSYRATKATRESITRSALRTEQTGHSPQSPLSVLKPFSALTLKEGPGANQSVEHLNSIWKKPGRNLDFPSTSYLSSYF